MRRVIFLVKPGATVRQSLDGNAMLIVSLDRIVETEFFKVFLVSSAMMVITPTVIFVRPFVLLSQPDLAVVEAQVGEVATQVEVMWNWGTR